VKQVTDEQIIDLMTARNEQALTEVETKYSRLCESITRRILGDEEDAKECVNDTLMALWNAIPPNRPKSLGAYAAKIARNLALNRYKAANAKKRRSNAVAVSLEELAECLSDGRDTTPDTAAAAFVGEVINAFVAGLPKRERVLFVRRYFYLDSVRQAAGYAQMTEGNAKTTLYRLRQSLKKALQKEGLL
jgi:RNA polymerase sigma-70 factor (ECF subfamily)